jgi:hypothetical protein
MWLCFVGECRVGEFVAQMGYEMDTINGYDADVVLDSQGRFGCWCEGAGNHVFKRMLCRKIISKKLQAPWFQAPVVAPAVYRWAYLMIPFCRSWIWKVVVLGDWVTITHIVGCRGGWDSGSFIQLPFPPSVNPLWFRSKKAPPVVLHRAPCSLLTVLWFSSPPAHCVFPPSPSTSPLAVALLGGGGSPSREMG